MGVGEGADARPRQEMSLVTRQLSTPLASHPLASHLTSRAPVPAPPHANAPARDAPRSTRLAQREMTSALASRSEITLRGSTEIVVEFFGYAVNTILYQRGLYPPETFKRTAKYGLTLLVSTDAGLNAYLTQVMAQLAEWLLDGDVERLVLVVAGIDSGEVLERWVFNVVAEPGVGVGSGTENTRDPDTVRAHKSEKDITSEIQAIVRQITASVTFLPLLEEACSFDLLVYTRASAPVPQEWEVSDPRYVSNSTEVRLRSFTTKVHRVDTMVSYRAPVGV